GDVRMMRDSLCSRLEMELQSPRASGQNPAEFGGNGMEGYGGMVLATRKPTDAHWSIVRLACLRALRRLCEAAPNSPPRTWRRSVSLTRPLDSNWIPSWHRSKTLPSISNSPKSFGFSVPTGQA